MKRLNVTCTCLAVYNSSIKVPDDMLLGKQLNTPKSIFMRFQLGN